jgi:hypothetical protein
LHIWTRSRHLGLRHSWRSPARWGWRTPGSLALCAAHLTGKNRFLNLLSATGLVIFRVRALDVFLDLLDCLHYGVLKFGVDQIRESVLHRVKGGADYIGSNGVFTKRFGGLWDGGAVRRENARTWGC